MNYGPGTGSSEPAPTPTAVYAVDIAVAESDPYERCTYPATVTYGGVEYVNACADYEPASGTELNSWAEDYDSGVGLISGIVPGTLYDSVFHEAEYRDHIPEGAQGRDAVTYIPTWYLSMTNDGTTIRVAFASEPLDDTFHDYAGSVGEERIGHFMMSCYDGTGSASAMYSWATGSSPTYSISITNCIAGCQARGEGYDLLTWPIWTYFGALVSMMWRSTDLQASAMYGASGAQRNSCEAIETTEYGMSGTPGSSSTHMALFWIEDLWGNIAKWCGAHSDADRQLEWNTGYCSVEDWDVTTEIAGNAGANYILGVAGTSEAGFFKTTGGGSSSTYYADYGYVNPSNFPIVGCFSSTYNPAYGGPFFAIFNYSSTNTSAHMGGRLVYRL